MKTACALALSFFTYLLLACTIDSEPAISGTIVQPGLSSYEEESTIVFQAELSKPSNSSVDEAEVRWVSSLDGILGDGICLSRKLSIGEHTITMTCHDRALASKILAIKPVQFLRGQNRVLGLGAKHNQLLLPAGSYSPFLYSLENRGNSITIQNPGTSRRIVSEAGDGSNRSSDSSILAAKSFSLMASPLPPPATIRYSWPIGRSSHGRDLASKRGAAADDGYMVGQVRNFHVADTTGANPEGLVVSATLAFHSDRLSIWIDDSAQVSATVLNEFLAGLKNRSWPRVLAIWGEDWVDLDGDDAIAVLVTPIINEQKQAIGFFNPADLYPLDTEASSPGYNPVSNEMDIIYLAVPVDDPQSFAYSVNSILATFCHEAAHLIGFSRSYYFPTANGQTVGREELFLDEGLAHLTESLCGYGESGGNLAFFARYLEKTGAYSLCGADIDGASDSIGKRGMASAFLSWQFWQRGGVRWDDLEPGRLADLGGLTFLRYLLATSRRGLDNISAAAGGDAKSLLARWFAEMDLQDRRVMERPAILRDPIGGEAISISPFFGELQIGQNHYFLNGPLRADLGQPSTCVSFSAVWGQGFVWPQKAMISIEASVPDTTVFTCFDMIE